MAGLATHRVGVATYRRRRARAAGLRGVLVEREAEIAVIKRALADARAGIGSVVVVEAFAGHGKSRLLSIAGDLARQAQMQVLGAQASELEREYPFGVATQLLEPRWLSSPEEERARLLEGPAWAARSLLTEDYAPAPFRGDSGYSLIHGLFWLTCNLTAGVGSGSEPLVMLIDDAHWADRPSLRFFAYLTERIAELPIALLVAVMPAEDTADRRALAALRRAARGAVLHPGSLSDAGVRAIVEARFGEADDAFCTACAQVTSGNPYLLTELLEQFGRGGGRPDAATAAQLAEMAPESVIDAVIARMASLGEAAGAVARAVAVLGDGAALRQVARLADLDMSEAAQAADALAGTHVFYPGTPLSFVHPLIRSAVGASMSPLERGEAHRRAAAILREEGAREDQIAAHLLATPPGSDPSAVEVLRKAARKALAIGAADTAARLLDRAVAEHPLPGIYPELLAELAQAESAAGRPEAVARLGHAIQVIGQVPRRAQLALAQGSTLHEQGRHQEAVEVLAASLSELDDDEVPMADELEAAYVAAALFIPELAQQAHSRGRRLIARVTDPPSAAHRNALARLALAWSLRGDDRASVVQLVNRAWGGGILLAAETLEEAGWPLLANALVLVDELERALEICDTVLVAGRQRDSPQSCTAASHLRAWPLYQRGCIAEVADSQAALDSHPAPCQEHARAAGAALACCHLVRGELGRAEAMLSAIEGLRVAETVTSLLLLDVRAQLYLAQHRPEQALDAALEAGRRLETDFRVTSPGVVAWRSTAALARLALGERRKARELAAEELEGARRTGITRVVIRDLRIMGLAEGGKRGLRLLNQAVDTGEHRPQRVEYIHALIEQGVALRSAGRRAAARDPLRNALELSHRGGATALAERAQGELNAAGGRPRRAATTGIEALTPGERRVGEVASKGLTTREIAEALFVTPKTVEFHLHHVYQKLGIRSRSQLAELLGRQPES